MNTQLMASRRSCLTALAVLLLSLPLQAADPYEAIAAYESGNYAQAIELFEELAAEELDEARFMLGVIYLNGDGVAQDYARAAHWFEQSFADPWGFIEYGKVALAIMYHNGLGVSQDYVKAIKLFEEAASIGNSLDVYNFEQEPMIYVKARPDFEASVAWFREAAEAGDAGAQFGLAIAYFRGLAVKIDTLQMLHWFTKSAEGGDPWGQYYTAMMYSDVAGVKNNPKVAAHWYRKAAEQGFADAQTMLAMYYFYGKGVEKSEEKAKYWLRRAIENGDIEAAEFWGWFGFGPFEEDRLFGHYEDGKYTAPGRLFQARYQLTGGSKNDPCCQESVADSFDIDTGKGILSMSNEYGAINGVFWGPAALVEQEDDPLRLLSNWFQKEVVDYMRSLKKEMTLLREEHRQFHGMDAWVATIRVLEGGTVVQYDLETGRAMAEDSVRGFVVFRHDEHVFALMCETNVMSFSGRHREYDPDNWDAFITELSAFYATMIFADG